MPEADTDTAETVDEQAYVELRRYQEARRAGLEHRDATLFAVSGSDVGVLRRLVKDGCPVGLLARIVT